MVAATEVVIEGVLTRTMEAWAWHTGNIRAHHLFRYAYDSCAIDATFQKLIASNEDIAQPPSSKLYCASVYMQGA